ncbi:Exopolygalacturonase [Dichanthelium oligosanthes]|uniref:Exopolygalacturonase n=1 Tax=Dichanthelium oligosanthes TaxID=888268 RepID=A0A1E5V5G4_9POAL|nr:Exopolygalacturonase [Dichanthelium oligosanthes]
MWGSQPQSRRGRRSHQVILPPRQRRPQGRRAPRGAVGSSDISKVVAKGDGKTDSTKALNAAWVAACGKEGAQTLTIPKGDYLIGPLNFIGSCNCSFTIQVDGNLLSSINLRQYKGNWIEIEHIDNLIITRKGTLDGQGKQVWDDNKYDQKYNCKTLPNRKGITIKDVTITAPGDSPNTDGIHMGDSSKVTITGTTIASGDDCISIGPGNTRVNITGVTYGLGHGISVGSLGRYKDEKDVTDINVKNYTLKKTSNGVRIKTYEDTVSTLTASKIHYENIAMDDVANPVIIDMKYCPNKICTSKGASQVTVKDVTFKNITGTSSTPEAVSLLYML